MSPVPWNKWNEGGGPKYPHEKVVQFCFRNYPRLEDRHRTRALDWGCGSGVHTVFLCAEGFQVIATDVSDIGITNTRRRLAGGGADLRVEGIEDLSLPPCSIDLVICVGVLDCAGPRAASKALRRLPAVLRPGGRAFSCSPPPEISASRETIPGAFTGIAARRWRRFSRGSRASG